MDQISDERLIFDVVCTIQSSTAMFELLLVLTLCLSPTSSKHMTGNIRSVSSWLFLDRFVFHGKSVENPKAEQARAIFQFKFPARSRISLLVYFNSAEDATFSRGTQSSYSGSADTKDAGSFQQTMQSPDVSLWKDVYSSDQSCMWRDRQSRRYGNSFDLFKLHQYSSATGEGLPVFDADEDGTDEVHVTNAANGWFSSKTKVKAEETTSTADDAASNTASNAFNASNASKTLKTPTSTSPNNDQVPSGLLPNETKWLYTAMDLSISSSSPKWFYFVVANCLPSKEITEKELQSGISDDPMYDVVGDQLACGLTGQTFCQGPLDKIWYDVSFINGPSHVSYNEEWIKTVRSTMVWIYSVLTIVVLSHVVRLSKLKKLHQTLKILLASVFMSFLGHILGVSYWNIVETGAIINRDQKGNQQVHTIQWPDTIRVAASLFDLIGHVLLLLLLILIAKGWTITRRKISAMGRVRVATYTTMYICINVSALGWSIWGYDPALVTFLYSSPPGVLVQLTRIASAVWFLYASWTTFRSNPKNRKFYGLFAAVFFIWIICIPVVALGFALLIKITYRGEAMFLIEQANMLVGHLLLAILWTPSNFDRMFPFFENKIHGQNQNSNHVQSMGSNNRRLSLTGGANTEESMTDNQKALYIAASLRYRLLQLQDKSDDLVEAITMLNEEAEIDVLRTMAVENASTTTTSTAIKRTPNLSTGTFTKTEDGGVGGGSNNGRSGGGNNNGEEGQSNLPVARSEGNIVSSSISKPLGMPRGSTARNRIPPPSGTPGSQARRRVLEMSQMRPDSRSNVISSNNNKNVASM